MNTLAPASSPVRQRPGGRSSQQAAGARISEMHRGGLKRAVSASPAMWALLLRRGARLEAGCGAGLDAPRAFAAIAAGASPHSIPELALRREADRGGMFPRVSDIAFPSLSTNSAGGFVLPAFFSWRRA